MGNTHEEIIRFEELELKISFSKHVLSNLVTQTLKPKAPLPTLFLFFLLFLLLSSRLC